MWNELKTYNIREPMDWATFQAMPGDLQKEYILWLEKEFDFRATGSKDLFGISRDTYLKYRQMIGSERPSKKAWDPAKKDAFYKWLDESAHNVSSQSLTGAQRMFESGGTLYLKAIALNLMRLNEHIKVQNKHLKRIADNLERR